MKSFVASVAVGLLVISAPGAQADDHGGGQGADWLMKINDAARQLNYSGTFVYVEGRRIESMRVTHRANGAAMRQRIYSLNGAPREVIRDDKQVWCYVPEKKLGVHEYRRVDKQGFPNLLPRGLEHLVKYYDVRTGPVGRIADRRTRQIRIVPKDDFRYGYHLWADEASGLLLKAALLDQQGRPIEQYMFTEVQIGVPIDAEALEPITPKKDLVWYGDAQTRQVSDSAAGDMASGNWVVEDVPEGFMLTRKIRRMSPMRSKMLEHYVYSDGLASVSVFVEELDDEASARVTGINKMGAVHAFGREIAGHQVTVVGEVPPETVDKIGMSVKPNTE